MAHMAVLTARPDLPIYRDLEAAGSRRGHQVVTLDALRMVAAANPPRALADGRSVTASALLARVGAWRADSTLAVLEVLEASGMPSLNRAAGIRAEQCAAAHDRSHFSGSNHRV